MQKPILKDLTENDVLSLPLGAGNKSDAKTVGQYLIRIAGFTYFEPTAVAPFKNLVWKDPLVWAFADANLIWVRTDEFGILEDYPVDSVNDICNELLNYLFDADFKTIKPAPEPKEWYVVYVETSPGSGGGMQDYFREPMTEEEAKTKAEESNEPYSTNPWRVIHLPA